MDWNKYFELLVDWKKLPAYKLEPRIDSFIGYYLPYIINEYKNTEIIDVIPEFPIRGKTIFKNFLGERSFRVDFLLIAKENPNYLVEFKSDSNSRRESQDLYLLRAKERKLGELVNGIKYIYRATEAKVKYEHLIAKLKKLSLLNDDLNFIGKNEEIEIIYIQPLNKKNEENILDFRKIFEWLDKKEDNTDPFETCFKNMILKWADD